jgi:Tol biopolymer transport system component/predicted Ser/Thr protein kinase
MTAEEYRRAGILFERLREIPDEKRTAAVDSACAGNIELRAQVLSLLEADRNAAGGSFLERHAIEDAARQLVPDGPVLTAPGTLIGNYRLGSRIGAGGMGVVYEAHDVRFERRAAIKILPQPRDEGGVELINRFQRESRAASLLNHPSILSIFDADFSQGHWFIATEFIEGVTLRQRMEARKLDFAEALEITLQCASALEAAHSAGVLHRDIKPENIMLRPDGLVKIVDFGLASVSGGPYNSRFAETQAGTAMGTPRYMSPEQARGEKPDARADVFSLGAVLYEMAAARPAFPGTTTAEIFAALLTAEPPAPSIYENGSPADLDPIISKALAKDRASRYQSMREFAADLRGLKRQIEARQTALDLRRELGWIPTGESNRAISIPVAAPRAAMAVVLGWGLAAMMTAVAAVLAVFLFRQAPIEPHPIKFSFQPPENDTLGALTVSPDGSRLAYVAVDSGGRSHLLIRPVETLIAQTIADTEGAMYPFWSPDSRSVAFFSGGKLKRIDVTGGAVQTLCEATLSPRGGAWNQSGVIIFAPDSTGPLYRVSARGGQSQPAGPRGFYSQSWPSFLPDGIHFLYLNRGLQPEEAGIYVGSLDSKDSERLLAVDSNAAYATDVRGRGYVLFVRESSLMAQPFEPTRRKLKGEALPVIEPIAFDTEAGQGFFSVSGNGMLVYYSSEGLGNTQLTWFDRSGKQVDSVDQPAAHLSGGALSPDGKRVSMDRIDRGNRDVWLIDLLRNSGSRFTFHPTADLTPVWSPDGGRVVFSLSKGGPFDLYQKISSGGGNEELLVKSGSNNYPTDWSNDGRFIAYLQIHSATGFDIWVLPLDSRKPFPFLSTQFDEDGARFSPDVHWIAYESNESGRTEVYVQRFSGEPAGGGDRWQISTNGGVLPRWRRDGKELYYLSADRKLMAVEVKTGATFEASSPRALFQTRAVGYDSYDVAADGQRFLINVPAGEFVSSTAAVVINWTAALAR